MKTPMPTLLTFHGLPTYARTARDHKHAQTYRLYRVDGEGRVKLGSEVGCLYVRWVDSRTWGWNPTAVAIDHSIPASLQRDRHGWMTGAPRWTCGRASGCGYDKLTAACAGLQLGDGVIMGDHANPWDRPTFTDLRNGWTCPKSGTRYKLI